MNEFTKKLIERLEKKRNASDTKFDNVVEMNAYDDGVDDAISIVNQLAEEYNNDVCEWKFEKTGIVWHCNGYETYNLPYAMNLKIVADDFECKCPHCGKKIKVIGD